MTHLRPDGAAIHIFSDLVEEAPVTSYNSRLLHFYVVPFASIFVVFPGLGVRRRLTLMAVSMAGLFLFQVAVVLICVEHLYAVELVQSNAGNYTETEKAFWEWIYRTADFFAAQFVPAAVLAILFVTQGGLFGRRVAAAPAAPAAPVVRRRRLPAAATIALVLVAAGAATSFGWIRLGRVRQRQAELEYMLGYRALRAGAAGEAAGLFTAALERHPRFAQARDGLGLARMRQDRTAESIPEFRAAVELRPDLSLPHLHLGNALAATSDLEGALVEYRTSADLEPSQKEAWFNLGVALRKLGRRGEAEPALRKVLELDAGHPGALLEISALLIQAGRVCEALPWLERLETVGPPPERESLVRRSVAEFRAQCGRR